MKSIIEVFHHGTWMPAAEIAPMGASDRGEVCWFEYLPEYVFGDSPLPISLNLPVALDAGLGGHGGRPCPPFIYDLVPQGRGRDFLLRELQLADADELIFPLVQAGAFNPVGNLRLDSAVRFFEARQGDHVLEARGFTQAEIIGRSEEFLEHIWLHAMLSAGTTGVQGAAPKFLLVQDADERWFADLALPDAAARKHWLVKLPRGRTEADLAVLRNEAAYLRVAALAGLRCEAGVHFERNMLFVPRFDRRVGPQGAERLHQESLAAVAGLRGFGAAASHFDLLPALLRVVSDPLSEALEYLKRDILNLALRNTDNHARNTALQRLPDGRVQLTPVFDLAPMYLDPEMIIRSCRWRSADGRQPDAWGDIIAQLKIADSLRQPLLAGLRAFADVIATLPETMREAGVDTFVIEDCLPAIASQHQRLQAISNGAA